MTTTDDVLGEVVALARAVEAHDDQDRPEEETPLQRLARKVLELHAMVLCGLDVPVAWREVQGATHTERLLWLCRRLWSRVAGGEVVTIGVRMLRPFELYGGRVGARAIGRGSFEVVCDAAPDAVYGITREAALVTSACFADYTLRLHGIATAADSATLRAQLAELGWEPLADGAFEPPRCEPVCTPSGMTEEQAQGILIGGLTGAELEAVRDQVEAYRKRGGSQ